MGPPLPAAACGCISRPVTSTHAVGADMGTEPAPFSTPAPFLRPVTVSQMWLSTSDGHLPDCPEFAAVGKHQAWILAFGLQQGAVSAQHLAAAVPKPRA